MARPLRLEFAGALYHLTARGNARSDIFVDDSDRERFLELLGKEIAQQDWRCYAYCLMDNHYHLLIETTEPNLVQGMRRLNGVYTQSFNRRHRRVGHVFQGRYKSIVVDKDSYGLELSRYIVLNAVRARAVEHPRDWKWSSYCASAGHEAPRAWLDSDWILGQLGSKAAYRRFVSQGVGKTSPWQELKGQIWLGDARFLKRMERLTEGKSLRAVSRAQQRPARPTERTITELVCRAYRTDARSLRSRANQTAFKAWVYLLRRAANMPLDSVAKLSSVSSSRISHIQRAIEGDPPEPTLQRLLAKCKVKH